MSVASSLLAAVLATLILLSQPLQRVDVALDPGHSRADVGAVGSGLREYQITLDLARRVRSRLEGAQLRVRMTREEAETFYAVHRERPFFSELVESTISGPVVVQVLEGENAIAKYRELMGATDPAKADPGTIRKLHARSISENSVHGSDGPETAAVEIAQFFSADEIVG